ncbi:hypothetical protein C942_01357 [Photobacterium marinum]|uniref:Uncharacterized protein n=1 Tax=Photobacterium marinum TaxID=1056511 RepID=L8JGQ0_9GAMM|nr:hypothetical protein C942_01357 [Photobacterium marinum]
MHGKKARLRTANPANYHFMATFGTIFQQIPVNGVFDLLPSYLKCRYPDLA